MIMPGVTEKMTQAGSSVFVKYNRMLHGERSDKGRKRETLTINFLKKFIHYAKNGIQPELTGEASERIATTYAEFRSASSTTKTGGTLPIIARTLETIIQLSTAHAKLKLRRQELKFDVEAAVQVFNFTIYHQELSEMEEHEQREMVREQRADIDTGDNDAPGGSRNMTANGRSTVTRGETEAMELDTPPAGEVNISPERLEAFSSALGKNRHAQNVEQMSIADIEGVVNSGAAEPYSASEIMSHLKIMQDKSILMIVKETRTRISCTSCETVQLKIQHE